MDPSLRFPSTLGTGRMFLIKILTTSSYNLVNIAYSQDSGQPPEQDRQLDRCDRKQPRWSLLKML